MIGQYKRCQESSLPRHMDKEVLRNKLYLSGGRRLHWTNQWANRLLVRIYVGLMLALLMTASSLFGGLAQAQVSVPTLLAPNNDSTHTGETSPPLGVPTLSWQTVFGADNYNVQISNSLGFSDPVIDEDTISTAYTPEKALADGLYYWRVRARVEGQWGNFSDAWQFTKDWSANGTIRPILISPPHDPDGSTAIASFGVDHFQWEPIPGAAFYKFEISTSPAFNNTNSGDNYYQTETLLTRHTPVWHLTNGVYYWRVTPYDNGDGGGNAGIPSEVRSFTYQWDAAPTLVAPSSNPLDETPVQLRFLPRFEWQSVAGASEYLLEVSTQEDFSDVELSIKTPNTDFTPEKNLDNNKDYYWRVKAIRKLRSGEATGPSSEVRRFNASWTVAPALLTPPNASIARIYPYFSWTPVSGAEKYRIQISPSAGFDDKEADETLYNATAYTQPEWDEIKYGGDVFWRVQAIDAEGNTTPWSDVRNFRFVAQPPPNLIYPEYYYVPDEIGMPVHTDRTIAYPTFVWDNTHQFDPTAGNGPAAFQYPAYYSITVGTDLSGIRFNTVNFTTVAAGLSASPTQAAPFTGLQDGQIYYWQVWPMDKQGSPMSNLAVTWQFRYDSTVEQLPIRDDGILSLIHPQDGFEAVGVPPTLGWYPVAGADHYSVEISRDASFSDVVDTAEALFPYYTPWQGRTEPMPFGMYWWRVRAKDASNNPLTEWSAGRRFALSVDLTTGNPHDYPVPTSGTLLTNSLLYSPTYSYIAGSDVTAASPYDLGDLHIVQDRSLPSNNYNWIFAFEVMTDVVGDVEYTVYIDVNRDVVQGATVDPRGKPITTDPLYRPEYAFHIVRNDDTLSQSGFWEWNGTSWVGPTPLPGFGGSATYDEASASIQLVFPYTSIIKETDTFIGSLAVTVFSSGPGSSDTMRDSIPPQPSNNLINRPALLSDMIMPLYPFDTPVENPIVFHELPSLRWRMPYYDSNDGYQIEIARDIDFTNVVETWESHETNESSFYAAIPTAFHSGEDYNDEESYYWRIRLRHERFGGGGEYDFGTWSPPMRFKLTSYIPGNPSVSLLGDTTGATPSFSWDRVEGAAGYTIQIDDDANMSTPIKNEKIDGNSYALRQTLDDGTYYWRVAMRRSNDVTGQWTPIMSFVKKSLSPTPISPVDETVVANQTDVKTLIESLGAETNSLISVQNDGVINSQPTFIWSAVITNSGNLRTSAPRYRLQWDDDPNFGSPSNLDTYHTTYSFVENQSLSDGTWYWRVAILDGNNKLGAFSEPQSFYKEYLPPTLLSPEQGAQSDGDILFEWSPLQGAASYRLEYADNEAFNGARGITTNQTSYIPTRKVDPGEYYWRVRMQDKDNRPGPYTLGRFSNPDPGVNPVPVGNNRLYLPGLRTP